MNRQPSLADQAVETLAAIQQMDSGIDTDDPERHAIWQMKRAAEQAVAEGLRVAMAIAWSAKTVRDAIKEATEGGKEGGE